VAISSASEFGVVSAYNRYLKRDPNQQEINLWLGLVPANTDPNQFFDVSIGRSDEAIEGFLTANYRRYVGRSVDPVGKDGFTNYIRSQPATVETRKVLDNAELILASSTESLDVILRRLFARYYGLDGYYQTLRGPANIDLSGVIAWTQEMIKGFVAADPSQPMKGYAKALDNVEKTILKNDPAKIKPFIDQIFSTWLDRPVDSPETLQAFTNRFLALQETYSLEQAKDIVEFEVSLTDEALTKHVNQAFNYVVKRPPNPDELSAWKTSCEKLFRDAGPPVYGIRFYSLLEAYYTAPRPVKDSFFKQLLSRYTPPGFPPIPTA
jgi:hypothetical protein